MVQTKLKSPADNIQDFVSNKPDDISGETNAKNKQQATLEVAVHNSEKLWDIIWTLKTVSSGYSSNSSKDIWNLFYAMFPDS